MATIELNKQVFDRNELDKTININFTQLITPSSSPTGSQITIEEFFNNYETLFYQIPKNGVNYSHEYLVKQSGTYIGQDLINDTIQALLEEIQSLREENIILLNQSTSQNNTSTTTTSPQNTNKIFGTPSQDNITVTVGEFVVPEGVVIIK
jgi:hypothetical protein